MLSINENLPLSQICGLTNVSQSWSIVTDSKRFNSNPKDYFAQKMTGMVFILNEEQERSIAPLIKESLYQMLEAYEDELLESSTDLIACRFQGRSHATDLECGEKVWFWIVGECGQGHYYEEILDILEMNQPAFHPLYVGPLDFTKQRFSGLNR